MRIRAKADFRSQITDGPLHYGISPREDYFVIEVSNDSYRVIDDQGEPILYPKDIFEVVDKAIPRDWELTEFADGEYHLGPSRTSFAGFYEDFFCSDGDRVAQAQTRQTLREVLEATLERGDVEDRRLVQRDLSRLPRL